MPTIDMMKEQNDASLRRPCRTVLVGEERELHELACLSGVLMDPQVFKIIVDLLRFHIPPSAIMEMLKSISGQQRHARRSATKHLKDNSRKPAV